MGWAVALPAIAAFVAGAGADLRVDLRAEARASTVSMRGFAPYTREAWLARPGADLVLEAVPLRIAARYTATVWTSDVEARPSPVVTQDGQIRLEGHHRGPWQAAASAAAARGWTDPLADPVAALQREGPSQSPALVPIEFQAYRAAADGTLPLDRRSAIGLALSATRSGAVKPADREAYPSQDAATAQVSLAHLLSPRGTLRLAATAAATRTDLPQGTDDSGWATGTATWRIRMTRTLDGWAGAGVGASRRDVAGAAPEVRAHPIGEIGVAYESTRGGGELSARTVPFTDRFTGDVVLMFQGAGTIRWRESARLSFDAAATGGATQSGDTALAALSARATYAVTAATRLEAGIVGRWQHERGDGAPSFSEIGAVVALTWESLLDARAGRTAR